MSTGPLIPPGLEGSNVSSLEDILNVTPGANETFIQTLRDAVLKEVERSVQERTEALWAKGKQVLNQAQQKHQDEVKRLMEEVALCQERQTLLAKENERLREVLQSLVSKATVAPSVPEALLSPSSTFAGTSPLPSDPETSNPSRPFTPSPFTPAVDFYSEVLLPEVPPLPFTTGAPGAPAPLSLAEALAAPPPQRTPVSLADSLAPVKDSSGSPESGEFTITITKTVANEELGLDVSHEEDGKVGLRVDGLRPGGVVEAWNQQCLASGQGEKVVRPGDKITQCNGLKGPSKILEECVSQQKLSLVIFREVATSPQRQMRADASEFVPGGV